MTEPLVTVYSTPKQSELAIIKSLLDSIGIKYFVTNENFNTLYGAADGFTAMEIKVEADRVDEAKELLSNFISPKNM